MQAIRQCSVCASRAAGGLLQSQADFSLWRGAACVRFLSNSERVILSSRNPGVHQTETSAASVASLNEASTKLCALSFTQQVGNLSHDSLVRRAASVVTDGSCTFLSQTSLALTEALMAYSLAVHTRITVQKRYLAALGKLSPAEEDLLLEQINSHRAQISDRLDDCKRFESSWIRAVNLCRMAAEAAHSSGAEQASINVTTNIQVAQSQVEEARKLSEDADKKLAETKVEEIQRMAEYASSLENSEEHEVHEAYLRED